MDIWGIVGMVLTFEVSFRYFLVKAMEREETEVRDAI